MQVEGQNRTFYHRSMACCPYLPRMPVPHLFYVTASMLFKHLYNMPTQVEFQWFVSISLCMQSWNNYNGPCTVSMKKTNLCNPSWWTSHGDDLLQSPGPLAGREGSVYTPLPQCLACHSDPACPSGNHMCTVYSSQECIWRVRCHQCSQSCRVFQHVVQMPKSWKSTFPLLVHRLWIRTACLGIWVFITSW